LAKCPLIKSYLHAIHYIYLSDFVPLEPLPSADLWIKEYQSIQQGGLLTSFELVFRIDISSSLFSTSTSQVLDAHHFEDHKGAQEFYVDQLKCSSSNHNGCHAYVGNSYYWNVHKCFPDVYLIDASSIVDGEQKVF